LDEVDLNKLKIQKKELKDEDDIIELLPLNDMNVNNIN
jgi:hypothetical protein